MTISLIVVQEMCIRMGVVTGQGLADLIREHFGVRWTAFVMLALLTANTGVVISEFVGIGQASELFGVPKYFSISIAGAIIWWIVVKGSAKKASSESSLSCRSSFLPTLSPPLSLSQIGLRSDRIFLSHRSLLKPAIYSL